MTGLAGSRLASPLRGRCSVPGDKSISHRGALFSLLGGGESRIRGYSQAADCLASVGAVRSLGGTVQQQGEWLALNPPVWGLPSTSAQGPIPVDCSRSGTTMRILAGILAGRTGDFRLSGHPQLLLRPMERVASPLRAMGATVELEEGGTAPMLVRGGELRGIVHRAQVASAQVKSAVLLAGLQAQGETTVEEAVATRDHSERLLTIMGARLERGLIGQAARVRISPGSLTSFSIAVPGDPSSASVIAAAGALVPGSDVVIEGVGMNPTRTRFFEVLRRMGAEVEMDGPGSPWPDEPAGAVHIRQRSLRGIRVGAEEVPELIDELPLLGLLATQAEGITEVTGAAELRVKESDRIQGLVAGLRALGADAEELPDGFLVVGGHGLRGGLCDSLGDHRLAMTFTIAGLITDTATQVMGREFIPDSFPGFDECLGGLL